MEAWQHREPDRNFWAWQDAGHSLHAFRRTAQHEGGHGIADLYLGSPVGRLVVERERVGFSGYVVPPEYPERSIRRPVPRWTDAHAAETRSALSPHGDPLRRFLRAHAYRSTLAMYCGIAAADLWSRGWDDTLAAESSADRALLRLDYQLADLECPELDGDALDRARFFIDKRLGPLLVVTRELVARFEKSGERAELSGDELAALVEAAPRLLNVQRYEDALRRRWRARAEAGLVKVRTVARRERNAERVVGLPTRPAGRTFLPAPLAALADARERSGARRTDIRREPWAPSPRPALAGVPLFSEAK
jgi:hypothetical protein